MKTQTEIYEYDKTKPETIQKMFSHIAEKYDRTNKLLSFNLHKLWNQSLVKTVTKNSSLNYMDLCSGTGEIAIEWIKRNRTPGQVTLVDFCPEMLKFAKMKVNNKNLHLKHKLDFIEADAMNLPLQNNIFDCITVAYGIRNILDPQQCFYECYRTLKPGGTFAILELSRPKNFFLKQGYRFYLSFIVPFLGKLSTTNKAAYEYLRKSIHICVSPEEMTEMLEKAGFKKIKRSNLFGGVAIILNAEK